MELQFDSQEKKSDVFRQIQEYLGKLALRVSSIDDNRPWGGFFVISSESTSDFINIYFPDFDRKQIEKYGSQLSPKILVVEPRQKLSWQYHNRRAELWKVIEGPIGVVTSDDNTEGPIHNLNEEEVIQFDAQVRHRLVGLDKWGMVAEIWQHTDPEQPSDESDIVRLSDAYGRASKEG